MTVKIKLLKCIELLTGQQALTDIEKEERNKKISSKMDLWAEIQQLAIETDTPIEDILSNRLFLSPHINFKFGRKRDKGFW